MDANRARSVYPRQVVVLWLIAGCGSGTGAVAPQGCPASLLASDQIDVSADPRVCEPLQEALAGLSPASRAALAGLVVVRETRGPCGEACPDLASALMSDAALAWMSNSPPTLHVPDAFFDDPRWRGGQPAPAAVTTYLADLGVGWSELVSRVRMLPGVSLSSLMPEGSEDVFEEIVTAGPKTLLGGEISRADLIRHELGHALLLRDGLALAEVSAWASLSDWRDPDGDRSDGFVGGMRASERPIVASRLLLGLPRGEGDYIPHGRGFVTEYARFDPLEDHAESLRVLKSDPARLARISPEKLLVLAASEGLPLKGPELRAAIQPGVKRLLDGTVDLQLAMSTLRALGPALLPEATELADPTPVVLPDDLHAEVRAAADALGFSAQISGIQLRPPQAAITAQLAQWEAARKELEEFQAGIDALIED